jgi:hypothetical protein
VTTSVWDAADLTDGMTLGMADGGSVTIKKTGTDITIDGAKIVGSVRGSNGMVHVVDAVIVPAANSEQAQERLSVGRWASVAQLMRSWSAASPARREHWARMRERGVGRRVPVIVVGTSPHRSRTSRGGAPDG